jgi:hypothetical protein
MIGIPAPRCEPGHVCWRPSRLSIVRSQRARQRTCLQKSFFWSWKRSLAAPAPTEARSSSAPRGTFRSSRRARAASLRVRSTMPLDTALTSSEWRDSRRPTSGHSSAMVSQSHLSAATGAMLEKGFTEYEFPRGIGSLPAETDGSSRVTRCASAFNRTATRQAARRPRR